jgi:hypothetical protein
VVGLFVSEEKIVVLVVVDEILEELRCAHIAQYGGESLSAGAIGRRWLGRRAQKSNCAAGGGKFPRENKL